jgi:glycosyltransferase involved in cell wall biosynthesis
MPVTNSAVPGETSMNQSTQSARIPDGQIRISVCMAVLNGANFIEEQIASILPQLGSKDEFVIVDDASKDNTIDIVASFRDERIRIIRQEQNRGVVQSFGRALEEAKGEIIFLTDHDDIWRADKVEKFLEMFDRCPAITVVMSDLVVIDAACKIVSGPKLGAQNFHQGVFRNLVRNRYQGSAMAFRRSILEYCLPFPTDIPIHDVWIGLVNQFVGEAAFIAEPLLFYRRHGSNDSRATHAPLMQMIRWRWALIKNLTSLYVRKLALRSYHLAALV